MSCSDGGPFLGAVDVDTGQTGAVVEAAGNSLSARSIASAFGATKGSGSSFFIGPWLAPDGSFCSLLLSVCLVKVAVTAAEDDNNEDGISWLLSVTCVPGDGWRFGTSRRRSSLGRLLVGF